jgi:hypothetical protein
VQTGTDNPLGRSATQTVSALAEIQDQFRTSWVSAKEFLENDQPEPVRPESPATLEEWDPMLLALRGAVSELATVLRENRDRFDDQLDIPRSEYERIKPMFQSTWVAMSDLRDVAGTWWRV